jgi:hypothetical protein
MNETPASRVTSAKERARSTWIGDFRPDIASIAERLKLEAATFEAHQYGDQDSLAHPDYVIALNGLKYVNTLVSPALRLWAPPDVQSLSDAQRILASGVGICGQQADVYMALMDACGIKNRIVQICTRTKNVVGSHVASEVFVDGKWRYVDISFASVVSVDGNIYNLMSLEDILGSSGDLHVLRTEFDPWTRAWIKNFGDPVLSLRGAEMMEVTFDGNGTLFVPFIDGKADFLGMPNFFGLHLRAHNRSGNLKLAFFVPTGHRFTCTLGVASFYSDQEGEMIVSDQSRELMRTKVKHDIGTFTWDAIDTQIVFTIKTKNYCTITIESAFIEPI